MNLRIAVGLVALSVLISAQSVSAAPVILICQAASNSRDTPFQMTIDSDRGTVELPGRSATQVNITDDKITFHMGFLNAPPDFTGYIDGTLDRVTAAYSFRQCDSAQGVCGPLSIDQCRKGEKQF